MECSVDRCPDKRGSTVFWLENDLCLAVIISPVIYLLDTQI